MPGPKLPESERREQLLLAAYAVAEQHGLDQVTARRVAEEAGSSPGLVFFHFGSKEGLLVGLLDHLLQGALDAEVTPEIAALPTALDRLAALLRIEIEGLPEQRGPAELFFAYWFLGRGTVFRERISAALQRYLEVFLPVCEDVVAELGDPPGTSGRALATLVVSMIEGATVQLVRDPEGFEVSPYLASYTALLGLPAQVAGV